MDDLTEWWKVYVFECENCEWMSKAKMTCNRNVMFLCNKLIWIEHTGSKKLCVAQTTKQKQNYVIGGTN